MTNDRTLGAAIAPQRWLVVRRSATWTIARASMSGTDDVGGKVPCSFPTDAPSIYDEA